MGDKQRVYTFLDGDTLTKIDEKAAQLKVSRSEVIRLSIDDYLTPNGDEDITLKDQEIEHLKTLIAAKDGEIAHLRYLTNDLRSLADNLASKVPMLTGPTEEPKHKHWWKFW